MAWNTRAVKSPWYGALIAAASIAVVSAIAVARDWDLGSWIWATVVCIGVGVQISFSEARRNRRLDRAARQAAASR